MTAIVHDYKEIARAARGISRSFDWYPNRENEDGAMFCKPADENSWLHQPVKHEFKTKGLGEAQHC